MKVKFIKTLVNAEVPTPESEAAGWYYLTAAAITRNVQAGTLVCDTGIAMEIPKGYIGLVFPCRDICETRLCLSSTMNIVDSSTESVKVYFRDTLGEYGRTKLVQENTDTAGQFKYNVDVPGIYAVGDRVARLLLIKKYNMEFIEA